ncbi:MAG: T9SS type A sorting domain-containing protein, partial [Paludibacteraceae bacterium]
ATASEWKCFEDNTDCKVEHTGIGESSSESERFIAYPNPFVESFSLKTIGTYNVTNITGMEIENGWSDGDAELGTGWPSGFYTIRINGNIIKVIKR